VAPFHTSTDQAAAACWIDREKAFVLTTRRGG
jgi:hypothetical protein